MKNLSFINVLVCIAIQCLHLSCSRPSNEIFIEAESFEKKGGWVVDPQFVEQMGSPYLLAHGLGKPVADASKSFRVKRPGNYHVWVRTINWAPGPWPAPGRFSVRVNSKILPGNLGTCDGWSWQYAGSIRIKDTVSSVSLIDLTGFEGRCDAIFLSTDKLAPTDNPDSLAKWRLKMTGQEYPPGDSLSFDLVVTGGGIAGCAAAIAAAEQGLNVALVHDRPVLGGNASSEIRVHTEGITWKSDRILSMLNTVWWPNGSPLSVDDDKKRHDWISRYNNIKVYLNRRAYGVNTSGDSITSIDTRETSSGNRLRLKAPVYIDCTGDGWIGYWAGAEYMYGREDSSSYSEGLDKFGDLWSPGRRDNRVMGSSVLWLTKKTGKPEQFPEVPWAAGIAGNYSATTGTWKWEYSADSLNQVTDAEAIRDHMLKAIYGSFYNARKDSINKDLVLEWASYLVGKRESRRLVGDYIYSFDDEKNMRKFDDAVVMEKRNIDVHYQQILKDKSQPDFLSEALYYKVDHYFIPYRCLYSKNIVNLLMAGRCFSTTHAGLGGPRVMNSTGQMGVATGYASSLCVKYKTSPRGVYRFHIAELKELIDNCNKPVH
ncbi:MAG: FAD-dependent oxidoreductase [Bacteroidales bacterium]